MKRTAEECNTTLEAIKLLTEIEDLKKNTSLTELAEVEKNIKEVNEKINTATKNKEKAIDEYNKTSKGKKEQLENKLESLKEQATKLQVVLDNPSNAVTIRKQKQQAENDMKDNQTQQNTINKKLAEIANAGKTTKQYDDELNTLNTEISKLNETKIELEKKCNTINKSITDKEAALKKLPMPNDKKQLPYIQGLIATCNNNVSKILSEAKEMFNTDWVNKETINKMNQ